MNNEKVILEIEHVQKKIKEAASSIIQQNYSEATWILGSMHEALIPIIDSLKKQES